MCCPDIELESVINFLDRYSWIYSFRWIDPPVQDKEIYGIQSVLDRIPACWLESLSSAKLDNLKALVSGKADGFPWPQELEEFASECRRLTSFLSHDICLRPSWLPNFTLAYNPMANCVDFVPDSNTLPSHNTRHMSPKKSHEVARMTTFLHQLLFNASNAVYRLVDSNSSGTGFIGTFQTSPLLSPADVEPKCEPVPPFVIDIGSGLGHFANSVALSVLSRTESECSIPLCRVYAVDCDPALDRKARLALEQFERDRTHLIRLLAHMVKRILFRLTDSNTEQFRVRIHELLSDEIGQSSVTAKLPQRYILTGLHCCGDLSQSMIQLFENDHHAEWMVLVGCCYHKMSIKRFPTSDRLRVAFTTAPQLKRSFCTEATFRLACQWSPITWLSWTQRDCNVHRVRLIHRLLFPVESADQSTAVRSDPIKLYPKLAPLLEETNVQFHQLLRVVSDVMITGSSCTENQTPRLEAIWNLTPGLLALQQLIQPLLETIVLADRVWRLREGMQSRLEFVGLARLFNPQQSPRCLALVARRCFN